MVERISLTDSWPKSRKCEFLDDDSCDTECRLRPTISSSSIQWIFNETSFSPDADDDIVPVYPVTKSQSPSGGQSIALPDIEIRDCWEPGMGLSDDDCLPKLRDSIHRYASGYGGHCTPYSECDRIATTLEREELVQYLQRQEIVKSLRTQADQLYLIPGTTSNVVIAQVSEPYGIHQEGKTPISRLRKKPVARRPKKDGVAEKSKEKPPSKRSRSAVQSLCNTECI